MCVCSWAIEVDVDVYIVSYVFVSVYVVSRKTGRINIFYIYECVCMYIIYHEWRTYKQRGRGQV